jgi:hypothetical protein
VGTKNEGTNILTRRVPSMAIESKLQQLFHEPIERITYLDPGYSGHASDVWLVKTAREERVVRSSRWTEAPTREFWWGCCRGTRT